MTGWGSHKKRGFTRYDKVRNPEYDWLRYSGHSCQSQKKNTGNNSYETSLLQRQKTRLYTKKPKPFNLLAF